MKEDYKLFALLTLCMPLLLNINLITNYSFEKAEEEEEEEVFNNNLYLLLSKCRFLRS